MSSNKSKKSQLSGEKLEKEKSRVVYERLKKAYEIGSDQKLAERFGIKTRQGIGERKKSGKWDPTEILHLFPDVNYEWIMSDDLYQLRTLPVRSNGPKVQRADSVERPKGGLSDQARKELAEQIEEIARILKDSF